VLVGYERREIRRVFFLSITRLRIGSAREKLATDLRDPSILGQGRGAARDGLLLRAQRCLRRTRESAVSVAMLRRHTRRLRLAHASLTPSTGATETRQRATMQPCGEDLQRLRALIIPPLAAWS